MLFKQNLVVADNMSLFMLFYMTFDFIAYTKFKEGQLGGENGLFFFTTGVFKCKIYVTSEFMYEKLQRNDGCSRRLLTQRIPSNVARSFAKGLKFSVRGRLFSQPQLFEGRITLSTG